MVCTQKQKPKIIYQFGVGIQRIFQSELSPIEVKVKSQPADAGDNFKSQGYTISYWSTNNFRTLTEIVKDYRIYPNPTSIYSKNVIQTIQCNENAYVQSGVGIDPSTLEIDYSKGCKSVNQRCSIVVFYKGRIIFKDQGDCPCRYEVQCGNCASGKSECKTNIYPGYCCVDCASIKSEIATIRNVLRSKS